MSRPVRQPPIVCPFCPLLCDDVIVDPQGKTNVACERAEAGFQSALGPSSGPRLETRPASETQLAEVARELFAESPQVRVITAGTDLKSARILQRRQTEGQIEIEVEATPTRQAMSTATGRDGVVAATLGEVRRHADQLWLLGVTRDQAPRLIERVTEPERPTRLFDWPYGASADRLAALSYRLQRATPDHVQDVELERLAAAILKSRYLAVVVGDAAFESNESEAAAVMLLEIISRQNVSRRAVLVQLDPAQTNRSVTAWSSNCPLQSHVVGARPRGREPSLATRVRLGDAVLQPPLPVALQIGGVDPGFELATHYMPASTVGVHRGGIVVRGDGTVTLPLASIHPTDRPTPAEWLDAQIGEIPNPPNDL